MCLEKRTPNLKLYKLNHWSVSLFILSYIFLEGTHVVETLDNFSIGVEVLIVFLIVLRAVSLEVQVL